MRIDRRRTRIAAVSAVALAATVALFGAQPAPAAPPAPRDEVFAKKLVKQVTGANVQKHMVALQAIADANGGNRAAGTPGYDRLAEYVARMLRKAGYRVTIDPINFVEALGGEQPAHRWTQTAPSPKTYVPNDDFFTFPPSPPAT